MKKDKFNKLKLVDFLKTCRANPMIYVDTVLLARLGITLYKDQREVLQKMFTGRKCLIPTHHAFGKSLLCALFIMTMINLYPNDCIITSLAPTFRQVRDILWVELRRIYSKCYGPPFVNGTMNLVRYEISAKSFAVGISPAKTAKGSETPQFLSGLHGVIVIVIIDEAGGVQDQIFEQMEGITSAGEEIYVIGIGNPLTAAGRFGRMCLTEEGEGYNIIHKRAYVSPNMVANGLTSIEAIRKEGEKIRALPKPKRLEYYENKHYIRPYKTLLSPGWVMECYMKWGESPLFFSRCIGDWSQALDDTLVPLARANEVMLGTYVNGEGKSVWEAEEKGFCHYNGISDISIALDCSGDGADKNSLCVLEGNRQVLSKNFSKTWESDAVDYRGTKLKEDGHFIAKWVYDNVFVPYHGRVITFAIDCTGGFGNTVYDSIMKYKHDANFIKIRKITFGVPAKDMVLYHDNIAEMAFTLADDINRTHDTAGLLLEADDDLRNQLTNRRKKSDGKNRNMLESKKDYKGRAGESPDQFDALMMSNWLRHDKGVKFDSVVKEALKNKNTTMTSSLKKGW